MWVEDSSVMKGVTFCARNLLDGNCVGSKHFNDWRGALYCAQKPKQGWIFKNVQLLRMILCQAKMDNMIKVNENKCVDIYGQKLSPWECLMIEKCFSSESCSV